MTCTVFWQLCFFFDFGIFSSSFLSVKACKIRLSVVILTFCFIVSDYFWVAVSGYQTFIKNDGCLNFVTFYNLIGCHLSCRSPQRKLFQINHTQKVLKPCKLTDCKNGFAHWLHHLEQTFSCKEVQHKTFCPSAENDFMKPLHTPSEFHCGYL